MEGERKKEKKIVHIPKSRAVAVTHTQHTTGTLTNTHAHAISIDICLAQSMA